MKLFDDINNLQPEQSWVSPDGKAFRTQADCVCYMCFEHMWQNIFKPHAITISRKDLGWLLQNEDFRSTMLVFWQNLEETTKLDFLNNPPVVEDPGELDIEAMLAELNNPSEGSGI